MLGFGSKLLPQLFHRNALETQSELSREVGSRKHLAQRRYGLGGGIKGQRQQPSQHLHSETAILSVMTPTACLHTAEADMSNVLKAMAEPRNCNLMLMTNGMHDLPTRHAAQHGEHRGIVCSASQS